MIFGLLLAVVAIALLAAYLTRIRRLRRPQEPGFRFVYINQDGSARELSPEEQRYLSQEFSLGDSGGPYIKASYESLDGWGSQSGFIARRRVPIQVVIRPVHPNYDAAVKELGDDLLDLQRAAGDDIVKNSDASITCSPNFRYQTGETLRARAKSLSGSAATTRGIREGVA
jgi:hypothetical protein